MSRYPLRPELSDYANRRYNPRLILAPEVYAAMNTGELGSFIVTEGSLDALENIPAGSVVAVGKNYYDQSYVKRSKM